jgi:glyoxylase I family protein
MHHVSITVNSLAESQKFYEDFFGFTFSKSFEREDMGARAFFLENNGFFLELWEFNDLHANVNSLKDMNVRGIRHIAFEVENLNVVVSDFRQRGLEVSDPTLGSSGHRYSYISDPNGVAIELYQM